MKTLLCYCGHYNELTTEDFGFEEHECSRCGQTISIPEIEEDFKEHNNKIRKMIESARFTGKVRIMSIQETGEEKCYRILPEDDEELIDLIIAGYKLLYPECRFFTEREENTRYTVNQTLLNERN